MNSTESGGERKPVIPSPFLESTINAMLIEMVSFCSDYFLKIQALRNVCMGKGKDKQGRSERVAWTDTHYQI